MKELDAWFYRQLARSREIRPEGVPDAIAQSPEIAVTILLIPFDGMRAVAARCIAIDGGRVRLSQG